MVSGSGQVTLRWEVPKGAGPFGYAVHYRKAGTQEAHTQVTGLSATTYTVTGLENVWPTRSRCARRRAGCRAGGRRSGL